MYEFLFLLSEFILLPQVAQCFSIYFVSDGVVDDVL